MAYQGNLDGLCGPYAIVNAFDRCGLNEEWLGQDLFNIACLAMEGWPNILWEGTDWAQMKTILKACQKALRKAYRAAGKEFHVKVEYPFTGKRKPRSNKDYWERFEEIFSQNDVVCGILGIEHPHEHWIAFENRKRPLSVFDSDPDDETRRIRKNDIYAGERFRRKWLVNPEKMAVFRYVGSEE
ncbi:MAG: hypothetical protein OXC14_12830 [Rhodospirillaceae bacterium]|nr:hypothetical protein [Rhodospirillaceae bacterium]